MALALLMVNVEVGAEQTPFPKLTGRVVDQAGILSESVEGQLSAAFKRHETQTSNQVVVDKLPLIVTRQVMSMVAV